MRDPRMRERMMRHENFRRHYGAHRERNRVFFGIMVVLVGVALLLRTMGFFYFNLEFSWPIILIIIGFFMSIKSGFRNMGGWILMLIGIAFMIPPFTIMGHSSQHLAWPAGIIIVGLLIAFRPRPRYFVTPSTPGSHKRFNADTVVTDASMINIDVTFGGRKEIVTSKEFKGGTISTTFGGCEVNMIQADFTTPSVILDIKVAFGGVELIIPAQWEVQNEINPAFGSVEDERMMQMAPGAEGKKLLILRGSCSFGSVEIKSY